MTSKDTFKIEDEFTKCAPTKTYTDGSCFTIKSLQKIARAYNDHIGTSNNKIIEITDSKKDLLKQLYSKIKECDSNQLCWLKLDWIKKMNDHEIMYNTFRPLGPQGKFKWLNTTNINDIMIQYEEYYKDFKFLGAVPYDFEDLPPLEIAELDFDVLSENISRIGMVINLDEHWKSGSHWVALFADIKKQQIYYFDSYGSKPKKRIAKFVKRIALWCYNKYHNNNVPKNDTESIFMRDMNNKYEQLMDIRYNKTRHQFKNSECGVYSVNFVLRLLKGETFDHICNNITTDDEVNQCRMKYFRFE